MRERCRDMMKMALRPGKAFTRAPGIRSLPISGLMEQQYGPREGLDKLEQTFLVPSEKNL
jgi:hypothetical protein